MNENIQEEQNINTSDNFTTLSWHELLQNLSTNHLEKLENIFKSNESSLSKEQFFQAVDEVFEHSDCAQQIIALYDLINKNNESRITWGQLLDFFVQNISPNGAGVIDLQINAIIAVPQTRREAIVKIVLIETSKYFCYAILSKHGRVGLYDGNLNFLTTYQLIMTREDINRREEDRRRRNRWVTDAIFCSDVLMFIVTNTARSVIIYEASGLKHVPLWLILSTPNIVECFAYKSSDASEKGESTLYMGDDSGLVFSFIFLQPKVLILRKKHNDKLSLFYWDELSEEKDFMIVKRIGRPHQESIKRLIYFDDNETLVSCSKDSNVSLIIKYVGKKNAPYVFKMPKGCNCFALSTERKILITGSQDGIIRLWNPIITSKSIGTLSGHKTAIADLKMMDKENLFMSCSHDGTFNLWDIKQQKCIQSFVINFPSFAVFGKLIEWGIECIYPGPKRTLCNENNTTLGVWQRSPILVACCNHIALIKLKHPDKEILDNNETQVLPPPPLQNSVLIPKMWNTSDSTEAVRCNEFNQPDMSIIDKRLKELEFILKKDLFEENGSNRSDINFKIATLERKKLEMQHHVARGAPYLALDLHEVHELRLTPDLPVPNKKKIKHMVEKIETILQDASCRDLIFSEPSTSRSPRSSRSSVIEFDY
ncbi:WD repeat-containing protein 64-like [Zophobas morio]|uniref:WD repeat-containing protein 64-like n=1 Tax=Zophobas morio TaxID=2755281 RepID=UPI00308338C0